MSTRWALAIPIPSSARPHVTRWLALSLLCLALAGCMTWHVRTGPVVRTLTAERPLDVAVRLRGDSTRWFRVREARLVRDTVVGQSRATGRVQRVVVPVTEVLEVAVREPNRAANDGLTQLAELGALVGMIWFIATAM